MAPRKVKPQVPAKSKDIPEKKIILSESNAELPKELQTYTQKDIHKIITDFLAKDDIIINHEVVIEFPVGIYDDCMGLIDLPYMRFPVKIEDRTDLHEICYSFPDGCEFNFYNTLCFNNTTFGKNTIFKCRKSDYKDIKFYNCIFDESCKFPSSDNYFEDCIFRGPYKLVNNNTIIGNDFKDMKFGENNSIIMRGTHAYIDNCKFGKSNTIEFGNKCPDDLHITNSTFGDQCKIYGSKQIISIRDCTFGKNTFISSGTVYFSNSILNFPFNIKSNSSLVVSAYNKKDQFNKIIIDDETINVHRDIIPFTNYTRFMMGYTDQCITVYRFKDTNGKVVYKSVITFNDGTFYFSHDLETQLKLVEESKEYKKAVKFLNQIAQQESDVVEKMNKVCGMHRGMNSLLFGGPFLYDIDDIPANELSDSDIKKLAKQISKEMKKSNKAAADNQS
jgi:hypothetical protein